MQKMDKKLSIIISAYNNINELKKCIDSVLKQSYKNKEIIVVYHKKSINISEIKSAYENSVKFICYNEKKLVQVDFLLKSKKLGYENSTGDYITFLTDKEYVSIDFYSPLIEKAQKKLSDITIGDIVLDYNDGSKRVYNMFNSIITKDLNENECIMEFLSQEGLCYFWYIFCNKIFSRKVVKEAMNVLNAMECSNLCDEIVLSTILYFYSKKVIRVYNEAVFYHENHFVYGNKELKEYIDVVNNSFNVINKFLNEKNILNLYKENIENWKNLIYTNLKNGIINSDIDKEDKERMKDIIYLQITKTIKNPNYFYNVSTKWDDTLENVKIDLCNDNIEYISFDIFDTLIVRPFMNPKDLFKLLDNYFRKIANIKVGVEFSKIRVISEEEARERRWNKDQNLTEITLDEIYDLIREKYELDEKVVQKIKEKEIEFETRFCSRRETAYLLYKLALNAGKKVICISDMYLPLSVISNILKNNGYNEIEKIYLSSEYRTTKSNGNLYKDVLAQLNVSPNKIIHIGDNFDSDVVKANENGLTGVFFPKATNLYWKKELTNNLSSIFYGSLPGYMDNANSANFLGIRCMIAVMVNKYFDNPYRYFNEQSDFNGDPFLVGYHVLGMHLFALVKWITEDIIEKKYDTIVFMARDGYCPMRAFEILKRVYKYAPNAKYLPVSRKSLIQVILVDKMDFYKLAEIISVKQHTPRQVIKYIYDILNTDFIDKVCSENRIKLDEKFKSISEFNSFITIVIDKLYNKQKHQIKLNALKEYFGKIYNGKACTFDIGYSARPELYISNLCNKKIDTYFENIASDMAYEHSKIGGFKLNTFYDYKPSVTGTLRESIISEIGPSCIGYNYADGKIEPVYNNFKISYQESFILSKLQEYSLDFIKDMVDIFGDEIKNLYYQKLYAVLPLEVYIHSSRNIDMKMLECISFEDSVKDGENINIVDIITKERNTHNQQNIDKLLYINEYENKSLKSEQYLEGKSIMDDESSNTEKNLIQKFKDMIKRK